MNVNHAMNPIRKAVFGLLVPLLYTSVPLLYTSMTMATEATTESTSDASVTPYIVNGSDASVSEFPSMASLFIDRIEYDGVYSTAAYCGATILDPSHILTAAHCIYGDEYAQLFTVAVPQIENTDDFPDGNIQNVRVSEIYYRSDYSNNLNDLLSNDIAILKLESALNIDSVNDVITRPDDESYRDVNNEFVAVGHGDTRSGFDSTSILQSADLTLVENATCAGTFIDGSALTDNQICFVGDRAASGLYGGTCQGDSGGPVYWKNGSSYEQVGITSFGPDTCGGNNTVTSVFTEIVDYKDWIDSVMAGSETANFVSTDEKRAAYVGVTTSSSSSSGGSVSLGILSVLFLVGGFRRTIAR
ncbi:serine protease [uncultured Vibrio sp.]|uniref:S1 family peptidase n=1 Tax=uncultured Vibrio sp. TaxID=114054 RepID=UPI00260482F3|nr:serine protease [uncultured Vibrio sp.]